MTITGSWVALVTPFLDNKLNTELLKELIEFHVASGSDGLVIAGTTGESATLNFDEKRSLFEHAISYAQGRIPLIANIGTNNTSESIELAIVAESLGYDGLLAVTPYYNKPSQRGLLAHFSAIAHASHLPLVLYNVPSRTSVSIALETVVELSKIENIVGIKEASGNVSVLSAIVEATPKDFVVLSGNDDLIVDQLARGAVGVISVVANAFPCEVKALVRAYETNIDEAYLLQKHLNLLNDVLYIEPNPVGIKALMSLQGHEVGLPRLPLVPLDAAQQAVLVEALQNYTKGRV